MTRLAFLLAWLAVSTACSSPCSMLAERLCACDLAQETNLRAWPQSGKHLIIDVQNNSHEMKSWVSEAIRDLSIQSSRALRGFMIEFGVDVASPRGSFVRLVHAFQQTRLGLERHKRAVREA